MIKECYTSDAFKATTGWAIVPKQYRRYVFSNEYLTLYLDNVNGILCHYSLGRAIRYGLSRSGKLKLAIDGVFSFEQKGTPFRVFYSMQKIKILKNIEAFNFNSENNQGSFCVLPKSQLKKE